MSAGVGVKEKEKLVGVYVVIVIANESGEEVPDD
jgi:hypothetical protein